jgi:hypothetical protein
MTIGACREECVCPCLKNRVTWFESEVARVKIEVQAKQRVIERLMENIPVREVSDQ